ncbi:hypothetical protein J6590_086952 [Homalodisca vitripennis]|nr:hypothetical protein J6590_086952 [Homalodisca vitripennis]
MNIKQNLLTKLKTQTEEEVHCNPSTSSASAGILLGNKQRIVKYNKQLIAEAIKLNDQSSQTQLHY